MGWLAFNRWGLVSSGEKLSICDPHRPLSTSGIKQDESFAEEDGTIYGRRDKVVVNCEFITWTAKL